MRTFLLSCLAVVALGAGAYALLEGRFSRNAGDAFAAPGSTRVPPADKPDPAGYTAYRHQPAGGVTSGRDPSGAGAGAEARP